MKSMTRYIAAAFLAAAAVLPAGAQMIKMNAPAILAGVPNIGYEHAFTPRFSASVDALWAPYHKHSTGEYFRSFQTGAELRYYFKGSEHPGDYIATGWYAGAYALYGDFNIGFLRHNDPLNSFRRKGYGVSAGICGGWKYEFNRHWQMDINLGIGYATLVYDKYRLAGPEASIPFKKKQTRNWIGPTRFSISFGYIINCGCRKH